jgi:NAD(P)-dependent dehydrogenase (short-subunit alcohol dehydrogenase family)
MSIPTAVVTGAASGIGRALAGVLADRGSRLVLADCDGDALHRVATELGAEAVVMDVASLADYERLAMVAAAPDLVCLNAGVSSAQAEPVWQTPPEDWQRTLDVNLGGVVNGLRTFVPRLLDAGGPRRLLITASLAGLATWPGGGAYAASKHAVVAVAEQAALALAGTEVSVTLLCPSLVRSGMSEVGADPVAVAQAALDATVRGQFASVPPEWAAAVRARGERLAEGLAPVVPVVTPDQGGLP